MSRTIRRKKDKCHNHSGSSSSISQYIYHHIDYWEGRNGPILSWAGRPKIKLDGKNYKKAQFEYHKDKKLGWSKGRYHTKAMRKATHIVHRAQAKQSLANYYKDNNYEIILKDVADLSWYN